MNRHLLASLLPLPLLLVAASCTGSANAGQSPASGPASKPAPILTPIVGTETTPPARVRVAHVLIAFKGAERSRATRSKDEAAALATEIYNQAKAGANFDELMKKSDDPGGGKYGMYTDAKAQKPGDYPRSGMAGAFGDIGFSLKVGEVGVAPHDPKKSPFGWHIITRIE